MNCERCEYMKERRAQDGWSFCGCFCPPNRGKMVTDTKDCPIGRTEVF